MIGKYPQPNKLFSHKTTQWVVLRRNVSGTEIHVSLARVDRNFPRAGGLDAGNCGSGTRQEKKDKWRERLAGKLLRAFYRACKALERKELFAQEMAWTLR